MERVGILGGTFDPPHLGHLILAETARESLHLDRVLFMPTGEPPHKQSQTISAVYHRLAMARLAIAGNPFFQLDPTDADRPAPHYTYSLLPLLQEALPAAQLWLLLGGDSLRDLPTWHAPAAIIACCRLAVLPRPEAGFDLPELEQTIPGLAAAVDLLAGPAIHLSGTQIRAWSRAGRSLRYLLPESVRGYIQEHQLYQSLSPGF